MGRGFLTLAGTIFVIMLTFVAGEILLRLSLDFLPGAKYLVTGGNRSSEIKTFEDFLTFSEEKIRPFLNWYNYSSNSLGFQDKEFEVPKPAGRYRVMAVGDSFCFGSVPYPKNVLTEVEVRVRKGCHNVDFNLLNFGIGNGGVWDYKTIVKLSNAIYKPDLVLVHFYMGNDGPDLYRHENDMPGFMKQVKPYSYLLTLLKNAFKLYKGIGLMGLSRKKLSSSNPKSIGTISEGGSMINPDVVDFSDFRSYLEKGLFSFDKQAYVEIAARELSRLYAPDEMTVKKDWAPILNELDEIRKIVKDNGMEMAIVFYPSELQVYPELRIKLISQLREISEYRSNMDFNKIDPQLPNNILFNYCEKTGIDCFDTTPALIKASHKKKPLYIKRNTHWNFYGNIIAAISESGFLEKIVCPK
jgi:hypothetical protein